MTTVGFIHTALIMVEVIKREMGHLSLEVNSFHIVDESLLISLLKMGGVRSKIIRRLCDHVIAAEELDADIIVVTCSSISPAVDIAKKLVKPPVLKIDEPMAEVAVTKGKRIGIVATVQTTLDPTTNLLIQKASEAGKEISISTVLCEEAFEAIIKGEVEKHDRLVLDKAVPLAREVDVIVLAQGSLARLALPLSKQIGIPVLSSPPFFIDKLKLIIEELEKKRNL